MDKSNQTPYMSIPIAHVGSVLHVFCWWKFIPTHESETLFLYETIKSETYSLFKSVFVEHFLKTHKMLKRVYYLSQKCIFCAFLLKHLQQVVFWKGIYPEVVHEKHFLIPKCPFIIRFVLLFSVCQRCLAIYNSCVGHKKYWIQWVQVIECLKTIDGLSLWEINHWVNVEKPVQIISTW